MLYLYNYKVYTFSKLFFRYFKFFLNKNRDSNSIPMTLATYPPVPSDQQSQQTPPPVERV